MGSLIVLRDGTWSAVCEGHDACPSWKPSRVSSPAGVVTQHSMIHHTSRWVVMQMYVQPLHLL